MSASSAILKSPDTADVAPTKTEEKTSAMSQFERLYLEEIRDEYLPPKLNLNNVYVCYANRSLPDQYTLKLHGYIVIEGKPRTITVPAACLPSKPHQMKSQLATVFYIGPNTLHAPYFVSDAILKHIEKSDRYNETIKKILRQMRNKKFMTTEHFLRELLIQINLSDGNELDEEVRHHINLLATNPNQASRDLAWQHPSKKRDNEQALCSALKDLIDLNNSINGNHGVFFPYSQYCYFNLRDKLAFEEGEATYKKYPLVNPTEIYELYQQQYLFQRYVEEKMNMGESVDFATKTRSKPETDRIMKRLVNCKYVPSTDPFYSNCNKASATLLQEAEDLTVKQEKEIERKSATVTGASYLSIGSSHRMFFWNSRIHQIIIDLFINREIKPGDVGLAIRMNNLNHDDALLQELADKKNYIMHIVDSWPLQQQAMALAQILDKNTPLGKVFITQRSWTMRTPDEARGYLKLASEKLDSIKRTLMMTEAAVAKTSEMPTHQPQSFSL
jgi:hypothetical protein